MWQGMHGYGGFGWFGLLIIIAIVVVVYLLIRDSSTRQSRTDSTTRNPKDILKERLAKGVITKEEYRELKKELEDSN